VTNIPGPAKKVSLFTMVPRSLWNSASYMSLPDDEARYLYFYFLTNPHQTTSGCCVIKDAYAIADLDLKGGAWTLEKYRKIRASIADAGLIMVDEITGEILITNWWDEKGPDNGKWYSGARAQCESISSPRLRKAALEALDAWWKAYQESKGSPLPGTASPSGDDFSPRDPMWKYKKPAGHR
jgi:hypothetical protein